MKVIKLYVPQHAIIVQKQQQGKQLPQLQQQCLQPQSPVVTIPQYLEMQAVIRNTKTNLFYESTINQHALFYAPKDIYLDQLNIL